MSRIGNRILKIPDAVNVSIMEDIISVSLNNNKIDIFYNKFLVKPTINNQEFKTEKVNSSKFARSQYGTINSLINNAFIGLTTGFIKQLEVIGVGYKMAIEDKKLKLNIGYSHPVFLKIPHEVSVKLVSSVELELSSFNKEILGEFAALIRKQKSPEPYKGKGIKYKEEVIERKVGKTSEGNKK